jgi:HPt (histidine-containing phosphotransfer) domain-containing protein
MDFDIPKEMKKTYLRRRYEDLELLKLGLQEKSIKEFNRVGHQLLGNAKSFGYINIEPLAHKMEKLTCDELAAIGLQIVHDFQSWIQRSERELHF